MHALCLRGSNMPRPPLHAEWSNFANTQKKSTKFSGMLGEGEKII